MVYIFLGKPRRENQSYVMMCGALTMLGIATARMVVDTVNIFRAFVPLDRTQRLKYMQDITQPIFGARFALLFTMMLVGDMIVVRPSF